MNLGVQCYPNLRAVHVDLNVLFCMFYIGSCISESKDIQVRPSLSRLPQLFVGTPGSSLNPGVRLQQSGGRLKSLRTLWLLRPPRCLQNGSVMVSLFFTVLSYEG